MEEDGQIGYSLLVRNTVGQLVIGQDLVIRIAPKTPISNLFGMLEFAYNLKSFHFGSGLVDVEGVADLYERLAAVLCRRVLDRVRRGLYARYVERNESLGYVTGRLDIRASSRLLSSGAPLVHCELYEHTYDIDENQILAWTTRLLTLANLARDDVRHLSRSAYRALRGHVATRSFRASDCIGRTYDRLSDDYRPLHALCRFFIEHLGPGMEHGKQDVMPYTVDMPRLFESFIAQWLIEHVPDSVKVSIQHQLKLSGNSAAPWLVDILITDTTTSRPVAVLDTKYTRDATPSAEDIQQAVAYAVEVRTNKAFLVYPMAAVRPLDVRVGDVQVRSVHFDLSGKLTTGGYGLLSQLGLS